MTYSNTSQTCGSKLAKFSNSRFLSLFFTSKLAVPLLSTQIRDFCYFLSPKIREFGGITVYFSSICVSASCSTVIPPNSRFLGLRKNRNREFGCLIKVPRVWRSQGLTSSDWNRELENFASLEPRVCEVLLYSENDFSWYKIINTATTVIPRKLAVPNSQNSLTRGSSHCSILPNSRYFYYAPKFAISVIF